MIIEPGYELNAIECRERFGGTLKYNYRDAA